MKLFFSYDAKDMFSMDQSESMRSYIPDTRKYDPTQVKEMLREYSIVLIKPSEEVDEEGNTIQLELIDEAVSCTSACGAKKLLAPKDLDHWIQDRVKHRVKYVMQEVVIPEDSLSSAEEEAYPVLFIIPSMEE